MARINKNQSGSIALVTLTILVLTLISLTGYLVYNRNKDNGQKTISATPQSQQQTTVPTAQQPISQPNEDDLVTVAFNAYCNTKLVPEGYERDNNVIGTMTAEQKKFIYSTDGKFVALNGKCGFKKVGEESQGGGAAAHIFKKTDNMWSLIVTTQQQIPQETIDKYGIPQEFVKTIGLD